MAKLVRSDSIIEERSHGFSAKHNSVNDRTAMALTNEGKTAASDYTNIEDTKTGTHVKQSTHSCRAVCNWFLQVRKI